MRIGPALGAALTLLAVSVRPAPALTILPNPVPVDNSAGIVGWIELLDVVTGLPTGGVVGDGVVGASDTTFVFEAHNVESFPGDFWDLVWVKLESVGGSSFIDPTAMGIIPPETHVSAIFISSGFAQFGSQIEEGATSNAFFVSYASPLAADGSLQFRFAVGEGVNFAFPTALLVPEPGRALLMALAGVLLLARGARGRLITR